MLILKWPTLFKDYNYYFLHYMPITLLSIIISVFSFDSLATLSFFRTYVMQQNVTFWICWIESLILIYFFFPVNDSRNSSSFLSYSGAKWIAHHNRLFPKHIHLYPEWGSSWTNSFLFDADFLSCPSFNSLSSERKSKSPSLSFWRY